MGRILIASLILLCTACAGNYDRRQESAQPPGFELAAPSALRGGSFIPGERSLDGAQYETALPNNRVTVDGTALEFLAFQDVVVFSDLAFAMYALDLTGYAGAGTLGVDWQGGSPGHSVWVGLANWAEDRWTGSLRRSAKRLTSGSMAIICTPSTRGC